MFNYFLPHTPRKLIFGNHVGTLILPFSVANLHTLSFLCCSLISGYYLLYFLKSYNKLDSKSKANLYKDLGEAIDDNNRCEEMYSINE